MSGLTVEDITQSVAYREIFGPGRQEGRQEGSQPEAAALALRQLERRGGPLTAEQEDSIKALPIEGLEALAVALLDFTSSDDLIQRLAANA
ncbi:MAG: DUF4351 domain-containing protein [Cyanobacteriota bacterium]